MKQARAGLHRREAVLLMGASILAYGCGGSDDSKQEDMSKVVAEEEREINSQESLLLQYLRTGALPFWVSGMFAKNWLDNMNFNNLPPDLVRYYRNAGSAYRNLVGAQSIWETIPVEVRMGGSEALRKFHSSRDWSHFIPQSLGGSDSATAGIFEDKMLNRIRGAAPMSAEEIAQARAALNTEAVRSAVKFTAGSMVGVSLVVAATEFTFAVMEYGLLYQEGKLSQAEMNSMIAQHVLENAALAIVVAGLVVGLTIVFPPLLPVLSHMTLPMAFASLALVGHRFYTLDAEWKQRVGLAPLQEAWDESKAVSMQVWEEASSVFAQFQQRLEDASEWVLREADAVSQWLSHGTWVFGIVHLEASAALERVLAWLRETFSPVVP